MAFIVKWMQTGKDADGGILKDDFISSEQAEQYIQDSFCNEPELANNILALVEVDGEGEEVSWAEYIKSEFDC